MKVWAQTRAESPFCDHGRDGPDAFVPRIVRPYEVRSYVNGSFAGPRRTGNVYKEWQFSVGITHESLTDAQMFFGDLDLNVPSSDRVWIEYEDQATRRVIDTLIDVTPLLIMGVYTKVSYKFVFGQLGIWQPAIQLADSAGIDLNASDGTSLKHVDTILWEDGTEEKV